MCPNANPMEKTIAEINLFTVCMSEQKLPHNVRVQILGPATSNFTSSEMAQVRAGGKCVQKAETTFQIYCNKT